MSSEKATAEQITKFIEQVQELGKLADEDEKKFSDWELAYVDEQADRVDDFGDKVFVSQKQAQTADTIYRKIVLGEDTRSAGDSKPAKKRKSA